MGMFDTINLDRPYPCPNCGKGIDSVQTKAFERILEEYGVGDCISHAEDIRIVKEELYCDACKELQAGYVYFAVNRGILVWIGASLKEARGMLNDLNLEKMILWYHDLYRRYVGERDEKAEYYHFLEELRTRFGKGDGEEKVQISSSLAGLWYGRYMQGAANAVEAIEQFKTCKKMEEALVGLWQESVDPLNISYAGEVTEGQQRWSVDVSQAEINERCELESTWTVMSEEKVLADGLNEKDLPERVLVVDGAFSEEAVCKAVEERVGLPRHPFGVRMVSREQPDPHPS